MKTWNPRFVHYARENNRTPEEMIVHDRWRYPGGSMTGYTLWINERWTEFCIKKSISREFCTIFQTQFDRYLEIRELQQKAEAEVARLQAEGWTQHDFARALKNLLQA